MGHPYVSNPEPNDIFTLNYHGQPMRIWETGIFRMEGKKEGKVDKTEGKEGSYLEGEEEEERTLI